MKHLTNEFLFMIVESLLLVVMVLITLDYSSIRSLEKVYAHGMKQSLECRDE